MQAEGEGEGGVTYIDYSATRSAAAIGLVGTIATSKDAGKRRVLEVEEEVSRPALWLGAVVGGDAVGVVGVEGGDGGGELEADIGVLSEIARVLLSEVLA